MTCIQAGIIEVPAWSLPAFLEGARPTNRPGTKDTLNKYAIRSTLHETGGGHTWINWREDLNDFASRLFK